VRSLFRYRSVHITVCRLSVGTYVVSVKIAVYGLSVRIEMYTLLCVVCHSELNNTPCCLRSVFQY